MSSRQIRRRRSHNPTRPSPARSTRAALSIPEGSGLLELMQWLLAGTCGFLREAGYSQEQLSRELLRLQSDPYPAQSVQRLMSRRTQRLWCVERLLRQWCEDLPFVHAESGAPRSLVLQGDGPCLATLLARHFPKLNQEEALACLEEHGAVVRQADGSYFPVQRGTPQVLMELVALRSCRYLQTGLRNLRARELAQSYPDEATVTSRLPTSQLAELLALSRQQLSCTIGTIQMWLMDRHSEDADEPCALVSAHGYVSVEPEAPPAGKRRRPKAASTKRAPRMRPR